jgi:hypothetical protein
VGALYLSVAESTDAFTYVSINDKDEIIGCCTGFENYPAFNKRLVLQSCLTVMVGMLKGLFFGTLTPRDLMAIAGDSEKLNKLQFPNCHLGLMGLRKDYHGTPSGKLAFQNVTLAAIGELKNRGCKGCGGVCRSENVAMSKWFCRLGFERIQTLVDNGGRSLDIFEIEFK